MSLPWRRTTLCALLLIVAVLHAPAWAQDFSIPPTGVLNNYDRVPIGQREAIEGGAFVARTNDAVSNWYNPAGLVSADRTGLSAAANAYEFTNTSLEGFGSTASRTRFAPAGRFFGGVLGSPIIKSANFRLGFSFSRPVGWEPGTIDASVVGSPAGGGTETLGFNSVVSFGTSLPALSAGFRLSDQLRLGAGVALAMTSLSVSQLLTDRYLVGNTSEAINRTLLIDGNTNQLVFTGGAQWEPTSHIRVGAIVRSPGLRIGGSTGLVYERSEFGSGGVDDIAFRDPEATLTYKIPIELVGGVAWVADSWEIEVNARYHGSVSPYSMITSDSLAQRVVIPPATDPIVTQPAFAPVVQSTRSIVNFAVGGSYRFSRKLRLHAGFFTDQSPNAEEEVTIFRTMNLTGATLGVSAVVGRLSGSVGVTGSTGTSSTRDIGPTLSASFAQTRLKVKTFSLLYSLAFSF